MSLCPVVTAEELKGRSISGLSVSPIPDKTFSLPELKGTGKKKKKSMLSSDWLVTTRRDTSKFWGPSVQEGDYN
jgi:hypothetical protein